MTTDSHFNKMVASSRKPGNSKHGNAKAEKMKEDEATEKANGGGGENDYMPRKIPIELSFGKPKVIAPAIDRDRKLAMVHIYGTSLFMPIHTMEEYWLQFWAEVKRE